MRSKKLPSDEYRKRFRDELLKDESGELAREVTAFRDFLARARPDARSFSCERCGAQPGEPCLTVKPFFGDSYRGQGVPADHVHQSRLVKLVDARRAENLSAGG